MSIRIATLATLVASAALGSTQLVTCGGDCAPDWDDCTNIAWTIRQWSARWVPNYYPGCTYPEPSDDSDPNSLNCQIRFCPEGPDVMSTGTAVASEFNSVYQSCSYDELGGHTQGDGYSLWVTNNPDYDPELDTRQMNGSLSTRALDRQHARQFTKRADGDTEFVLVVEQHDVALHAQKMTGNLPAGSRFEIDQSKSRTAAVETSVGFEVGFWEIFSASADVSVTQEYTTSSSWGFSINIDCDSGQTGQVWWAPLYDRYEGFGRPSRENIVVDIPVGGGISGSNYEVRCLG